LGIKVSLVETKQVDLATEMQRAIARQAEAERERRAKVIHAEGEPRPQRNWPRRQKLSVYLLQPCIFGFFRPYLRFRPRKTPQ